MNNEEYKYSKTFLDPAYAYSYESRYSGHSYDDILWNIEKNQLQEIVSDLRSNHQHIKYLDFAVGTGRVISFIEKYVDSSIGVDISPAMIEIAKPKIQSSRLYCIDITQPNDISSEKYDLITAFRFFLNADLKSRSSIIHILGNFLKDDNSRLVFNNHGNIWSHKLLMWPFNSIRNFFKPLDRKTNYMTLSQANDLAESSGLEIVKVIGYGLLSPKARWILPFKTLQNLESQMAKSAFARYFGVNQIYIAKKRRVLNEK